MLLSLAPACGEARSCINVQAAPRVGSCCPVLIPAARPLHRSSIAKDSYGRGAGDPMVCSATEELNGALCYPQCGSGYRGDGPVCWCGAAPACSWLVNAWQAVRGSAEHAAHHALLLTHAVPLRRSVSCPADFPYQCGPALCTTNEDECTAFGVKTGVSAASLLLEAALCFTTGEECDGAVRSLLELTGEMIKDTCGRWTCACRAVLACTAACQRCCQ